jgi:hypothetical protein
MAEFLASRFELRDRNVRHAERFSTEERALLDELLGDLLRELGYGGPEPSGAAPSR